MRAEQQQTVLVVGVIHTPDVHLTGRCNIAPVVMRVLDALSGRVDHLHYTVEIVVPVYGDEVEINFNWMFDMVVPL